MCDRCNNYFARKIEGPLLEDPAFRNLRAWYQVPNKAGRPPALNGFVAGTDIEVGVRLNERGLLEIRSERGSQALELQRRMRRDAHGIEPSVFLFEVGRSPPKKLMSRLLAKMALEAVALCLSKRQLDLSRLIDEPHYDRIRTWARVGNNYDEWPFSERVIFPQETLMRHPTTGQWVQVGFGYDLLLTKRPETYFAFCFYGYEFVINVGGPSVKGYEQWLSENNGISPLVERVGMELVTTQMGDEERFYLVTRGAKVT